MKFLIKVMVGVIRKYILLIFILCFSNLFSLSITSVEYESYYKEGDSVWLEKICENILREMIMKKIKVSDKYFFVDTVKFISLQNGQLLFISFKNDLLNNNDLSILLPYIIIKTINNSEFWIPKNQNGKNVKCRLTMIVKVVNSQLYLELLDDVFDDRKRYAGNCRHTKICLKNFLKIDSINTQDTSILNHLPKCLDSLKTKNDSSTTLFFHVDKTYKINLVPVNSTDTIYKEKLETELNKIYYPYGVSVSLNVQNKIEEKSWDINNDGKLNTGDGEFLSRYTDEMSALNYLLKTRTDFDKEAIYLFVLDAATGSNTKGDMPIKSQFGYIFKPTSQVISHEIAHGFFQLKHTFDDGIALQKNTTTNLMDYNDGDKLYKFQWDLVHDKGLKLFSFLQDSAGRKWETDGHYGTVYLVARMLGMDDEKAKQLAVYTESPDHDINSKTGESNVSGTYMYAEGRVNDHALTGGLWIDEQNKTSKWIEQTDVNNLKEIGRLLHRLGDCYSHTKYEEGYDDNVLPENRIMYGQSDGESKQHYFWDFSKPDQIYLRPKLYLEYVNRLAFVLSEKFNLSKTNFQINVFEKMVKFAKNNQCSLIGIIDYETAKLNGKKEVYIFVLPEKNSNGQTDHLTYVENTIKYIIEIDKIDKSKIKLNSNFKKVNFNQVVYAGYNIPIVINNIGNNKIGTAIIFK